MLTPNSPDVYRQWLQSLPPEQRREALQRLLRDYGLEQDQAALQYGYASQEVPSPTGTLAGPASNPYTAYVAASPLEHLVAGVDRYQRGKQRQALEGQMADLSRSATQAGMDVAQAKLYDPEALRRKLLAQLGIHNA